MKSAPHRIALALTWDGARWPVQSLPPKARSFLSRGKALKPVSAKKLAELFSESAPKEIRICWVPCLKGGEDVLCLPFTSFNAKRSRFKIRATHVFGDVLGVIYFRATILQA